MLIYILVTRCVEIHVCVTGELTFGLTIRLWSFLIPKMIATCIECILNVRNVFDYYFVMYISATPVLYFIKCNHFGMKTVTVFVNTISIPNEELFSDRKDHRVHHFILCLNVPVGFVATSIIWAVN